MSVRSVSQNSMLGEFILRHPEKYGTFDDDVILVDTTVAMDAEQTMLIIMREFYEIEQLRQIITQRKRKG